MIRIVSSQYGAVFSIGSPFSISPTIYVSANKITGPPHMMGPLYLLTQKDDQIIFFKNSQKIIRNDKIFSYNQISLLIFLETQQIMVVIVVWVFIIYLVSNDITGIMSFSMAI